MSCCNNCSECPYKVVVSTAALTGGVLVLTLPDTQRYSNGCKYCFILGTALPAGIPIDTPVSVVVGDGTVQFPLLTRCGAPVVAQQLSSRQRYPFRVATTAAGGNLIILRCLPDVDRVVLAALNDAVAAAAGGDGA